MTYRFVRHNGSLRQDTPHTWKGARRYFVIFSVGAIIFWLYYKIMLHPSPRIYLKLLTYWGTDDAFKDYKYMSYIFRTAVIVYKIIRKLFNMFKMHLQVQQKYKSSSLMKL